MAQIKNQNTHLEQDYADLERRKKEFRRKGLQRTVLIIIGGSAISLLAGGLRLMHTETAFAYMIMAAVVSLLLPFFQTSGLAREQEVLAAGIEGEADMEDLLSTLPDAYCVYRDLTIPYDGKTSEADTIVVGPTGVFVIEVKNHRGRICGDAVDKDWIQHKVGRGGTPYQKTFYSPLKQVGTHVYRVAGLLRKSGVGVYVIGLVYFANEEADVQITGSGVTEVYANNGTGAGDGEQLLKRITGGRVLLKDMEIRRICSILERKTQ